jgi:hypothetical protein
MSTAYVVIENGIPYPNVFITYSSALNAIMEKHNSLESITLLTINDDIEPFNKIKDYSDDKIQTIYIYKLSMIKN